jgi:hypothetical protein
MIMSCLVCLFVWLCLTPLSTIFQSCLENVTFIAINDYLRQLFMSISCLWVIVGGVGCPLQNQTLPIIDHVFLWQSTSTDINSEDIYNNCEIDRTLFIYDSLSIWLTLYMTLFLCDSYIKWVIWKESHIERESYIKRVIERESYIKWAIYKESRIERESYIKRVT